jgi:hypothetical protein
MTRDRSDAIIVRRDPATGPPERDRYEPREDGRWTRIDEVWSGCAWHGRGTEVVKSIGFEGVPPECVDGYDAEATPAETHLDDPAWSDDQTALDE